MKNSEVSKKLEIQQEKLSCRLLITHLSSEYISGDYDLCINLAIYDLSKC